MTLDAKDLKHLQWAIALLIILTLVGGSAIWTSEQMEKNSNQLLLQAMVARKDIQAKLTLAREEHQELTEKLNRFQMLKARGFIGPERRLDWVESIARIKRARRIFKLDYEFAPQRRLDASILPGGGSAGGFEFMSSQMQMQIHVLHEGELLDFIADLRADLRKTVDALVHVRSCTIERLAPGTADRGSQAQLTAECTLEWITLKEGK